MATRVSVKWCVPIHTFRYVPDGRIGGQNRSPTLYHVYRGTSPSLDIRVWGLGGRTFSNDLPEQRSSLNHRRFRFHLGRHPVEAVLETINADILQHIAQGYALAYTAYRMVFCTHGPGELFCSLWRSSPLSNGASGAHSSIGEPRSALLHEE